MIACLFYRISLCRISGKSRQKRSDGILKEVLMLLSKMSCSLASICCHEGVRCFPWVTDEVVQDLDESMSTFFIENLRCLMFQESVTCLLPYFSTKRVLSLLTFLEKFRHLFETRIRFLLLLLSFLNIGQKLPISLIIDFLSRPLRIRIDILLKSINPINFLFRHSN